MSVSISKLQSWELNYSYGLLIDKLNQIRHLQRLNSMSEYLFDNGLIICDLCYMSFFNNYKERNLKSGIHLFVKIIIHAYILS